MSPETEFSGLLRITSMGQQHNGLFEAYCVLVNDNGEVADTQVLYVLKASYSLMGAFVEAGQFWRILTGVGIPMEQMTSTGYRRPMVVVEPVYVELERPSGKHIIWHLKTSKYYPGIGERKAESLYFTFGDALLATMDTADIDALACAPLVTRRDAEVIVEGWQKHGCTKVFRWFQQHDIEPHLAKKVFDFHGASAIIAIEQNPYRLLSFDCPWNTVDELAQALGVASNDSRRIKAATIQILWSAFSAAGHTKMPILEFLNAFDELLGSDVDMTREVLRSTLDDSRAFFSEDLEYLHLLEPAAMEMVIANRIASNITCGYSTSLKPDEISRTVECFERQHHLKLTEQQLQAIITSISNRFSIITGGAGVGKTTVLKALYALFDVAGVQRIQLALSGRAAMRMTEATGEEASTIAGYLYHFDWKGLFAPERTNTFLVVDEASMIDVHSMYMLIQKTPAECGLILIGDPCQLQPVGSGLVLHELIRCPYLPCTELTVVKRQGETSSIPVVADEIRNGRWPTKQGRDAEFRDVALDLIARSAVDEYAKQPYCSQILCCTNQQVKTVNQLAQARLNPAGRVLSYEFEGQKYQTELREGDPVICKKNMYETGLRNGSLGRILTVFDPHRKDDGSGQIIYGVMEWDDGILRDITFDIVQSIQSAYGITIHKAQGSQFPVTIFLVARSKMLDRTLAYTAVTRAQEKVFVLGDLVALKKAIVAPPSAENRHVGLRGMLDAIMTGSANVSA